MHASRYSLVALALVFAGSLAAGTVRANEPAPATVPGAVPLSLDAPVALNVESHGVSWKGYTYHLVRLSDARFQLADDGRLTATVRAGTTTFDQVTYDLHAAVYDANGKLLGTARTEVPVERIWLGKVLNGHATLKLDFGRSRAYANARQVALALSEQKVLTPDDWAAKPK